MSKGFDLYVDKHEKAKTLPKFHNAEKLRHISNSINNMQCMVIFSSASIGQITPVTDKHLIEKQAKVGAISPIDYVLKAGPTGLDSANIELFQALKIQTKVVRNQLEVVNDSKVLFVGQKITISEINLMKKFNIKPYLHTIQMKHIYMSGNIFGTEILKINDQYLKQRVLQGINNVAKFSLGSGVPTKASAPHSVLNGLTNLLGLKLHTGIDVPALKGCGGGSTNTATPVEAKVADKGADKGKDAKGDKGKDAKGDKGKDAGKGKAKEPEVVPEGK
jgi:hypothetical protein